MSNPVYSSAPIVTFSGGAGVTYTTGGAGGGGVYGPPGAGGFSSGVNYKLTAERLEEWQWFQNFMEQNPDIKERYAVHKTYEILNNDQTKK